VLSVQPAHSSVVLVMVAGLFNFIDVRQAVVLPTL